MAPPLCLGPKLVHVVDLCVDLTDVGFGFYLHFRDGTIVQIRDLNPSSFALKVCIFINTLPVRSTNICVGKCKNKNEWFTPKSHLTENTLPNKNHNSEREYRDYIEI